MQGAFSSTLIRVSLVITHTPLGWMAFSCVVVLLYGAHSMRRILERKTRLPRRSNARPNVPLSARYRLLRICRTLSTDVLRRHLHDAIVVVGYFWLITAANRAQIASTILSAHVGTNALMMRGIPSPVANAFPTQFRFCPNGWSVKRLIEMFNLHAFLRSKYEKS